MLLKDLETSPAKRQALNTSRTCRLVSLAGCSSYQTGFLIPLFGLTNPGVKITSHFALLIFSRSLPLYFTNSQYNIIQWKKKPFWVLTGFERYFSYKRTTRKQPIPVKYLLFALTVYTLAKAEIICLITSWISIFFSQSVGSFSFLPLFNTAVFPLNLLFLKFHLRFQTITHLCSMNCK